MVTHAALNMIFVFIIISVIIIHIDSQTTEGHVMYCKMGDRVTVELAGFGEMWNIFHDNEKILVVWKSHFVINQLSDTSVARMSRNYSYINIDINNVSFLDSGVYRSSTPYSRMEISRVVLVVTVKPSTPNITAKSPAVVGKALILSCRSTSNSLPIHHGLRLSYLWKVNDTIIIRNDKYQLKNGHTMRNAKLDAKDKYNRYMCMATEEKGLMSDPTVYVLNPRFGPQFVTLNQTNTDITVKEGILIPPISCSAECNPPCKIYWKLKTSVLNTAVLNLGSAERSDDGTYLCIAIAGNPIPPVLQKRRSSLVRINVQYKASIIRLTYVINNGNSEVMSRKHQIEVDEHDSLVLTCTVDADPLASVVLLDKQARVISKGGNIVHMSTNIKQIKCEQSGIYIYQASNVYNKEPAIASIDIRVRCTPRDVYNGQKIFSGRRDQRIIFSTIIVTYPPPKVIWFRPVTYSFVHPFNSYTYNVSAHVDITGKESYGKYSGIIFSGKDGALTLGFTIQAEAASSGGYENENNGNIITGLTAGLSVTAFIGVFLMLVCLILKKWKTVLRGRDMLSDQRKNKNPALQTMPRNTDESETNGVVYEALDGRQTGERSPGIYDTASYAEPLRNSSHYEELDKYTIEPEAQYNIMDTKTAEGVLDGSHYEELDEYAVEPKAEENVVRTSESSSMNTEEDDVKEGHSVVPTRTLKTLPDRNPDFKWESLPLTTARQR